MGTLRKKIEQNLITAIKPIAKIETQPPILKITAGTKLLAELDVASVILHFTSNFLSFNSQLNNCWSYFNGSWHFVLRKQVVAFIHAIMQKNYCNYDVKKMGYARKMVTLMEVSVFQSFLLQECIINTDAYINTQTLWLAYSVWSNKYSYWHMQKSEQCLKNENQFVLIIKSLGIKEYKSIHDVFYLGIDLKRYANKKIINSFN